MVLKLIALLFWKASYWRIFCESYFLSTQRQNIDQFFPCSFLQRAWGNVKANQRSYPANMWRMRGKTCLWRLRPLPADWYQDVICGGSRGGGGGAACHFCGPAPHILACSTLQLIVTTSYHGCLQCGHTKKGTNSLTVIQVPQQLSLRLSVSSNCFLPIVYTYFLNTALH